MLKPKLLLSAGVDWSGTSSLYQTLKKSKIAHKGDYNQPGILYWLEKGKQDLDLDLWFDRKESYDWEYERNEKFRNSKPESVFAKDATLDDYVDYYTRLSNSERGSVCQYVYDNSNVNAKISSEYLTKIATTLKDNFDVKVLMIVRNPVRRSYSHTSSVYRSNQENFPDSISYWKYLLQENNPNISKFSYVDIYRKFAENFPTHPIVMEELWGGNVEPLEMFLEDKIQKLYYNCYYPEKGTKAPRYDKLEEQYMSDMQNLSEEDCVFAKKHLQWVYDEWYHEFKTRPWE